MSNKRKNTKRKGATAAQRRTIRAQQARRQMWAVVLFAVGLLFLALTFIQGSKAWLWVHNLLFGLLGWSAYVIAPLILYIAVTIARDRPMESLRNKLIQLGILILLLSGAIEIFTGLPQVEGFKNLIKALYDKGVAKKGGGVLALLSAGPLTALAGSPGPQIMIILGIFVCVMFLTGATLLHLFQMVRKPVQEIESAYHNHKERRIERDQWEQEALEFTFDELEGESPVEPVPKSRKKKTGNARFDIDVDISEDKEPEEFKKESVVETPELTTQETAFYQGLGAIEPPALHRSSNNVEDSDPSLPSSLEESEADKKKAENTKATVELVEEAITKADETPAFVPPPKEFGVDTPVEYLSVSSEEPVPTVSIPEINYSRPHPLEEDIRLAREDDISSQELDHYLERIRTGENAPFPLSDSEFESFSDVPSDVSYAEEYWQSMEDAQENAQEDAQEDLAEDYEGFIESSIESDFHDTQDDSYDAYEEILSTLPLPDAVIEEIRAAQQAQERQEAQALAGNAPAQGLEVSAEELAEKNSTHTGKETTPEPTAKKAPVASSKEKAPAEKKGYQFPPLSLLKQGSGTVGENISQELRENGEKLVSTLNSFGVETKIINISRGPAVTRYELQPSAGVKISRITGLADDIALNLAAAGIRIEAPIPGKAAVGIEVPNKNISMVRIREIMDTKEFRKPSDNIAIALGENITGHTMLAHLSTMPHVLIAGATGSGKSVCINSIIISILYKYTPEEVKLLMIDPKVVELGIYNGIPHLLVPVVTDPKKASGALSWAVSEMQDRYRIFADHTVRDLTGYNRLAKEDPDITPMPQIVIIIDELSDLMMAAPNEVEDSICRLAQMARAAGMHLVIATQRPSVDVITGLIKANIPSRIAFAVSSQVDSRTILDTGGAEKLLGRGDMLFFPTGAPKPMRIQGCFVSDEEVENVVGHVKANEEADYNEDIVDEIDKLTTSSSPSGLDEGGGFEEEDELTGEAIDIVIDAGQASISQLQRRLRVGYARAGRLIDTLEQMGIVGPHEGSRPRQVLMTRDEYFEMQLMNENAPVPLSKEEKERKGLTAQEPTETEEIK